MDGGKIDPDTQRICADHTPGMGLPGQHATMQRKKREAPPSNNSSGHLRRFPDFGSFAPGDPNIVTGIVTGRPQARHRHDAGSVGCGSRSSAFVRSLIPTSQSCLPPSCVSSLWQVRIRWSVLLLPLSWWTTLAPASTCWRPSLGRLVAVAWAIDPQHQHLYHRQQQPRSAQRLASQSSHVIRLPRRTDSRTRKDIGRRLPRCWKMSSRSMRPREDSRGASSVRRRGTTCQARAREAGRCCT